jgi:hypothetical protein
MLPFGDFDATLSNAVAGLNLLVFGEKIEQDAENRRWQVVCSRRGGCFSLLTIYYAPSTLVAK